MEPSPRNIEYSFRITHSYKAYKFKELSAPVLFNTSGAPGFAREYIFWRCPELILSFIIEKLIL